MKHRILLTLFLALACFSADAEKMRRVRVKTPGTLPTLIGEKQKYTVKALAIEGTLNGTDLRFLREMAGSDYRQQATPGSLRTVDLSRATYTPGGLPYIFKDEAQYVLSGAPSVPDYLFRNCKVEHVILPQRMDAIGIGSFELSHLRDIRIPEDAILSGWTFNQCDSLTTVEFPEYLTHIGQNCFRDCGNLRSIRIHDLQMLCYHAFENVPALEEVVIDGTLGHVDGWFCHDCPQLRRIEFGGHVVTTGGQPIASNCPRLSDITFSGICQPTNFGSVENCPLVRQCNVTGIVVQSSDNTFLPKNFDPSAIPTEKIREMIEDTWQIFENRRQPSPFWSGFNINKPNISYNLACAAAQKGLKDEALQMLGHAAGFGYNNLDQISVDSDLESLRGDARYGEIIEKVKKNHEVWQQEHDYLQVLRKAPAYSDHPYGDAPAFTYAPATDADLIRVREFFNLDSIAGKGDEISQMKNIMYWLHDAIPHDGSGGFPSNTPRNAIDLYKACKAQQRGLNCRGLALVLSEMYLAMGWPARALTCQPKDYRHDRDCHVIDMVWSRDLKKWVWMDPSFAAFVTDEDGLLLHPGEVRQRIIDGRTIILNEDANWNHKSKQVKEEYIDQYMAKNLYYLSAYLHNAFGTESPDVNHSEYYTLSPENSDAPNQPALSDEQWFWQSPQEQ